jgi:septum formation protein
MEPVNLKKYHIVLASQSPRRRHLLKELGLKFESVSLEMDEVYPGSLKREEIALYLAEAKARAYPGELMTGNTLLITADTIVWLDGENIGKPTGFDHAVELLTRLSGRKHEVITGVCLKTIRETRSFYSCSEVCFRDLSQEEIRYYVAHFKPYDKAGAYGVQEWIGYIGITRIDGSFYNVMGLPVQHLYEELKKLSPL